ncbi:hypothetical protein ACERCG_09370 [Mannheimia sp. E30BD]|uniref:hypothetical protein n=1 Tax=Mannheimia sp. E30BD TaxID=3278708 RepID=UPI00359ECEF2
MFICFGLVGCSVFSDKPLTQTKRDNLQSFLIVQNKLYIVGELHDYQFEHDLVTQLNHFLKSPYANHIEQVEAQFIIEKSPKVEGEYKVYLSGDKLKPTDRARLKSEFSFNDAAGSMMYRSYKANGQIVKLANRNEILQKYRFKKPIEARVIYYEFESDTSAGEIALAAVTYPITIPLAIAAGVALLPFQMICFALAFGY